jgi:L-cysteine S-thiosulfotransferase
VIRFLLLSCLLLPCLHAGASSPVEQGKAIAEDRNKGNCLSCHFVQGGEMTGTIAPPLISMKLRYPNVADLRVQIWDATVKNPETVMPPYGRHLILTEEEIDLVLEYIYSL